MSAFALLLCLLPEPPSRPGSGPGGAEYPHGSYTAHKFGEDERAFWVFLPDSPKPDTAPVIIFLHGWSVVDPEGYGAWIEHLARRGAVVIYPRYQKGPVELRAGMFPYAVEAIRQALAVIPSLGVVPDTSRVAIMGHSFGGLMAVAMAGSADSLGLPWPKAVMIAQAGGKPIPWFKPERIPPGTLLLAVAGDRDNVVGDSISKKVIQGATNVPDSCKDFLVLVSDDHGSPGLVADHTSAMAGRPGRAGCFLPFFARFLGRSGLVTDALDWFGYWKLFDGLTDAAFWGKNRQYALGGTPEQLFMGAWSDGTPVKQPERPLATQE